MLPNHMARPRANQAIQGLLLGLPLSMALWVGIGVFAVTAIS